MLRSSLQPIHRWWCNRREKSLFYASREATMGFVSLLDQSIQRSKAGKEFQISPPSSPHEFLDEGPLRVPSGCRYGGSRSIRSREANGNWDTSYYFGLSTPHRQRLRNDQGWS